jgi:hypothetical protein
MTRAGFLALALAAFAGCSAPRTPADLEIEHTATVCSEAQRRSTSVWKQFRRTYPYHQQTVALSPKFSDGCRVLIVSEPPPDSSRANVQEALGADASRLEAHRLRIGYDGWVEDWVTALPAAEPNSIAPAVQSLAEELFGTAYKMYLTPTDAPAPPLETGLNVRPSLAELAQWLRPETELTTNDKTRVVAVKQLLSGEAPGVYLSKERGLVVWAIPKRDGIGGLQAQARQFALDSDLVIGALASPSSILLAGRDRQLSPEAFPPLRYETIRLLANTERDELQQSFERTNFFAGRYDDANDWAPIFLSPSLVDTEYGSLLDIADQFLKQYSQAGQTRYENFDYPEPKSWPFPKPASLHIGAKTLVFNWNTGGIGRAAQIGDTAFYCPERTGALSVAYIPDGARSPAALQAGERARDYFAASDNPILARVVQYTAVYQAFLNLGMATDDRMPVERPRRSDSVLEHAGALALRRLERATIEEIIDKSINTTIDTNQKQISEDEAMAVYILSSVFDSAKRSLKERLAAGATYDQIAAGLVGTDRMSDVWTKVEWELPLTAEEEHRLGSAQFARSMMPFKPYFLKMFAPAISDIKAQYTAAASEREPTTIRTPSIVVSHNTGNLAKATGGHNIGGYVYAHRVDISGARSSDPVQLLSKEPFIEYGYAIAPRNVRVALGVSEEPSQTRGLSARMIRVKPVSFTPRDSVALFNPKTITVRREGESFVMHSSLGEERFGVGDLTPRVVATWRRLGRSAQVDIDSASPEQARKLALTLDVQSHGRVLVARGRSEIAAGRFRVRTASIRAEVIPTSDADVNVSITTKRQGLLFRVRCFFGKLGGVLAHQTSRIKFVDAAIERVRAAFGARRVTVAQFSAQLRSELQEAGDVSLVIDDIGSGSPVQDLFISEIEDSEQVRVARAP